MAPEWRPDMDSVALFAFRFMVRETAIGQTVFSGSPGIR